MKVRDAGPVQRPPASRRSRRCLRPTTALALEDSPTGARAALAAAIPVIIVPDLVQPPRDVAERSAGVYDSLDAVRLAALRRWTR